MKLWRWMMLRLFGLKPRNKEPIGANPEVRSTTPEDWIGWRGIEPEKFEFKGKKRGFFS